MYNSIAILGAGNLGLSIAEGLIKSGSLKIENLVLAENNQQRADMLREKGYKVTDNPSDAVSMSELVMLVVKPWQIDGLLTDIKNVVNPEKHVLVSCVTGATSSLIFEQLGKQTTLFRVMPNTGISVQDSMSCISAFNATPGQIKSIEILFRKLGEVIFIPEEQMPAATALAGCGIAFALRFIRATIQGGVEIGFGANDAKLMAAQIVKGAAELILKNNSHPESEIDKVTTPKGVTITGLNEMEHAGFSSSIIKGILASYNKIEVKK